MVFVQPEFHSHDIWEVSQPEFHSHSSIRQVFKQPEFHSHGICKVGAQAELHAHDICEVLGTPDVHSQDTYLGGSSAANIQWGHAWRICDPGVRQVLALAGCSVDLKNPKLSIANLI